MRNPRPEYADNVVRIHQWAKERGILDRGKITTQANKLGSEMSELAFNLTHSKPVADDIGDCIVVLTILDLMNTKKTGVLDWGDISEEDTEWYMASPMAGLLYYLGRLQDKAIKSQDYNEDILYILNILEFIAYQNGLKVDHCMDVAWNDIKDRKGILNEDGNFVKESDPAYMETVLRLTGGLDEN